MNILESVKSSLGIKRMLERFDQIEDLVDKKFDSVVRTVTMGARLPVFPCGVMITGSVLTHVHTNLSMLREDDDLDAPPKVQPKEIVLPFCQGESVILGPKTTHVLSLCPQKLITKLSIAAYGPCTIMEVRVGNETLDVWSGSSGDGSAAAYFGGVVQIGYRLSIHIKSWDW